MPAAASDPVELRVRYDGPDLGEVADLLGRSVDAVVGLHTASVWTVAFGGFAPGFAYLVTDHERLAVPRRAEPRVVVPAGSVGLAGPFSGVYPRSSPGGWRLIGTTDAVLWDAERGALLGPGTAVRFRAVGV
jgi:KipI family sensor histidine kinase inhibitor